MKGKVFEFIQKPANGAEWRRGEGGYRGVPQNFLPNMERRFDNFRQKYYNKSTGAILLSKGNPCRRLTSRGGKMNLSFFF